MELTKQLLQEIFDRGLVLRAVGNGGAVSIVDPTVDAEFEDANQAVVQADYAVDNFLSESQAELEGEKQEAENQRFREAVDAGDLEAVREIVGVS